MLKAQLVQGKPDFHLSPVKPFPQSGLAVRRFPIPPVPGRVLPEAFFNIAGILAVCDRDHGLEKWRDIAYPLKERFRYLRSPKGRPPKEQFIYDYRESGVVWAVFHALSTFFKVLFPKRKNNG